MKYAYIVATQNPAAKAAFALYAARLGRVKPERADILIALGGDGTLLDAAQSAIRLGIPCYGVNYGRLGFLLNEPSASLDDFVRDIETAHTTILRPFAVTSVDAKGVVQRALAVNDVTIVHTNPARAVDLFVTMKNLCANKKVSGNGLIVGTEISALGYFAAAGGTPPDKLVQDVTVMAPLAAMPLSDGYFNPCSGFMPQIEIRTPPSDYRKTAVTADRTTLTRHSALVTIERAFDLPFQLLHAARHPLPAKYANNLQIIRNERLTANLPIPQP